ncbi:tetratricopeptide repeat-containing sulfotransferase family protein [Sphingomonas sp.]|uniref:tetratricopeptide repeat-containing sulfotransferase family protein n=1 Tax=Sphingomonas sp. TaxID=28214 RepID=UPI0025F873E9|nr:tetratricopeptide repeat-containing sulfotransferase family protein [Sphingomonas sp.]MBV9526966.1 sulfotransferase [Sphingomonas sp.]
MTTSLRLHPALIEAAMALNDNRLDIAERILKPYLKDDPFDVAAMRMLAELAARIGRWRDSEALLRRAIELAPGFTAARANLALVLGRTGRPAEALELLDDIFDAEPEELGHWNLKAATLGRLGDFDEAIDLYEQVLKRSPEQPRVWLSYGHMLKTVGRQADGIAAYRRAIAIRPALGEAWWSLANLKTVQFDEADVAAIEKALDSPGLDDDDRLHLEFALGKAMHDARRTDEAFAHYAAGNALRLEQQPYRSGEIASFVDRCVTLFTPEAFATRPGGCDAPDPIFIAGMPRAGSTLVEQILSSHSLVEGTSELSDLPVLAGKGGGYPGGTLDLSADERRAFGEEYIKRTSVQRRTARPFFIDKLPNNWLFVPFIQLVLPNAKIIDVRRHPLACCLSNFRQHFARGQAFTYDLADVGHYYSDYVRLMAHVDAVLPGRVHRVIYERLVDDTEAEVRALLGHCGLDFEPACLEFHKTERAVRTASSEQVRQPIHRDATAEWQAYEPHLASLKDALGPVVAAYPDPPVSFLQR